VLKRPEVAISHYLKAIELKPKDPRVRNACGICYVAVDKLEEALIQFKEAVGIQPMEFSYWYNKAETLKRMEKWAELNQTASEMEVFSQKQAWLWFVDVGKSGVMVYWGSLSLLAIGVQRRRRCFTWINSPSPSSVIRGALRSSRVKSWIQIY